MRHGFFPEPIRSGRFRDGLSWKAETVRTWIANGGLNEIMLCQDEENNMAEVHEGYENANKLIAEAQAAYTKTLTTFRSTIKNDLAAISSSAEKVKAESGKIHTAYVNAVSLLVSPEMEKAIANAERLAVAMKAVAEVQTHNITFKFEDGAK